MFLHPVCTIRKPWVRTTGHLKYYTSWQTNERMNMGQSIGPTSYIISVVPKKRPIYHGAKHSKYSGLRTRTRGLDWAWVDPLFRKVKEVERSWDKCITLSDLDVRPRWPHVPRWKKLETWEISCIKLDFLHKKRKEKMEDNYKCRPP